MPEFVIPKTNREKTIKLALAVLAGLDEKVIWKVTVAPLRNTRSAEQNAYMWAVPIKMISAKTGYEPEEVHEYLMGEYFGWKDRRVPKTPRNPKGLASIPKRTTTKDYDGKRAILPTTDFSEYVEFIQRFAAEKLGLVIPDPDPTLVGVKRGKSR